MQKLHTLTDQKLLQTEYLQSIVPGIKAAVFLLSVRAKAFMLITPS
jgi:hypothetical protein